jgi:hypothetical protein
MPKNSAHPDPFFTLLQTEIEKERSKGSTLSARYVRLAVLLALHCEDEKTTNDGWQATVLAGHIGIPAPMWAIEKLEQAERDSIAGFTDIEVALGFKGKGKGQLKNCPVQRRVQDKLHEELCFSVRLLISSGESIKSACQRVAKKLKEVPDWNDTVYPLRAPNPESLRRAYRKWEKDRGREVLGIIDKGIGSIPQAVKEMVLKKFD